MCTSTPISKEKVKDVCEISNITLNASTISVLATETVIENVTVKENEVSKEGVNMDIANKLEEVNEIRTIELKADENEIEEVEMKIEDDKLDDVRPAEDNRGLTKYKSPLDHIQNNRFVKAIG